MTMGSAAIFWQLRNEADDPAAQAQAQAADAA